MCISIREPKSSAPHSATVVRMVLLHIAAEVKRRETYRFVFVFSPRGVFILEGGEVSSFSGQAIPASRRAWNTGCRKGS